MTKLGNPDDIIFHSCTQNFQSTITFLCIIKSFKFKNASILKLHSCNKRCAMQISDFLIEITLTYTRALAAAALHSDYVSHHLFSALAFDWIFVRYILNSWIGGEIWLRNCLLFTGKTSWRFVCFCRGSHSIFVRCD